MKVDWNIVCDKCKQSCHLEQDMGGICSFGYGYNEYRGAENAVRFISRHLKHNCAAREALRVVKTDNIPSDYTIIDLDDDKAFSYFS